MKRILSLLLLGLAWGPVNPLSAQESAENELTMVRQLTKRKWYDLAEKKMEELLKRNDPRLNAEVPLELARVKLGKALQLRASERIKVYNETRNLLEAAAKANAGKRIGVEATIELAHINTAQGHAILTNAKFERDAKQRHELARPAEAMFLKAIEDYDKAIKGAEQAIADPANAPYKAELEEKLPYLKLERAITMFYQGCTYINRSNFKVGEDRGKIIDAARKTFEEIEKSEKNKRVTLFAAAWMMKCSMELNDQGNFVANYQKVVGTAKKVKAPPDKKGKDKTGPLDPIPDAPVRLAEYFWMQGNTFIERAIRFYEIETIGENPISATAKPLDRLKMVEAKGQNLEAIFTKHGQKLVDTEEGEGIIYELAFAFWHEAEMTKDAKLADPLFKKAEGYFKSLGAKNSNLGDLARDIGDHLARKRLGGVKGELTSFEDYVAKAETERDEVRKVNGKLEATNPEKDKEKFKGLELERRKHLKEIVKSLNMALALAAPTTSVKKVDDARYFLCGAYITAGDPFRAAIVAEALGRSRSQKSAAGAAIAVQTYATLQNQYPDSKVLRKRLDNMIGYVLSPENQATWKDEAVTSLALYQLGMEAKKNNEIKKAIDYLAKLSPVCTPDFNYTQGQIVFMAQEAKENTQDKKLQGEYVAAAKAALGRMTKLNPREDSPSVIVMYFFAKMEMSKFMYSEAFEVLNKEPDKAVEKFKTMAAYVKDLRADFDKVPPGKMSGQHRDQVEFSMSVMTKYADLGIAKTRFGGTDKNRLDEVIAATKNVVENTLQLAKKTPADQPIPLMDYRVRGEILSLALRAHVQKGDLATGKTILAVLRRLRDPKGEGSANAAVAPLVSDIANQLRQLAKQKDAAELKTVRANYASFLDEIAKEYDAKGWDTNAAILMGHAFASVEMHNRAAQIYSKVQPPPTLNKIVPKKAVGPKDVDKEAFKKEQEEREKWDKEIRPYWAAQVEYVRALRASKEKDAYKTAEKSITALLKHPNGRYQLQMSTEKNLFLEDEKRYREAYLEWQKFMDNPALKDRTNKDVAQIYFTAYANTARTCFYMGLHDTKLKNPAKFITSAARMIVNLELSSNKDGWNIVAPSFEKLLKEEPKLKAEYDDLLNQRLKDDPKLKAEYVKWKAERAK